MYAKEDLERWKRAVVHLEGATDSVSPQEMADRWHDVVDSAEESESEETQAKMTEYSDWLMQHMRENRYQGTALFLTDRGGYYLVTARHVLSHEAEARRSLEGWPREMVDRAVGNWIFPIIFRAPRFGAEPPGPVDHDYFLMTLGAGVPEMHPYTYSTPELDLAIISLNQSHQAFARRLLADGLEPVTVSDVASGPTAEGQEVFSVGFPASVANLDKPARTPVEALWGASVSSLPVTSFGRVAMLPNGLPFFWVDMSLYPGNSGGPVVGDGRLVGIVHGQASVEPEPTDPRLEPLARALRTRIPFADVSKAEPMRALLEIQRAKDASMARARR